MPLPAKPSGQFLIVSFQVKHAPFDAVTPLLGVYPGEMKACPQRQMFTGVLYTIVMPWKQPKMLTSSPWRRIPISSFGVKHCGHKMGESPRRDAWKQSKPMRKLAA